jgi:methylmalonyl-CoA/ethylmalonyl-CoA epimerase
MTQVGMLRFHHFGLAARIPARAVEFLQTLGYSCAEPIHDPLQGVDLRWCTRANAPPVEVVSAIDDHSTLASILAEQGTSFYHLCYETAGTTASAIDLMRSRGARVVTVREPLPAILFEGRLVSFHMVHGFGVIELVEPSLTADEGQALE